MMMMVWCFTSLSILFKSNHGDGRVIMKGSVNDAPYSHELNSEFLVGFEPGTSGCNVRSTNHLAIRTLLVLD